MSNKNYIFFDIDNTLIDLHKPVPASTVEAFKLLRKNGHSPFICTGRTKIIIPTNVLELGFDGIIAGGGSYIEYMGKEIFRQDLPHKEVVRVITSLRNNGFSALAEGVENLYYDDTIVTDPEDETFKVFSRRLPNNLKPLGDIPKSVSVAKISAKYTASSNPDAVIRELSDDYLCVNHYGFLFETIPKTISKGFAIKELMKYLGEGLENTYAFGDSYNDYSMLVTVAHGVVMENGDPKLLKEIPEHAAPLSEDGIYKKLKDFKLI